MYCSKCGAEVIPGSCFCAQCGNVIAQDNSSNNVVQNPYTTVSEPAEIPSSEHKKDFEKCFNLVSMSALLGFIAGVIALCDLLGLKNKFGSSDKYSTLLNFCLVLGIIAFIASVAFLGMSLNMRLKPNPTRTMLRYGAKFIEFSTSSANFGIIALCAPHFFVRNIGNLLGDDSNTLKILCFCVVGFLIVVESYVSIRMMKYKTDEKYNSKSNTVSAKSKSKPEKKSKSEKTENPDNKSVVTLAASESDMKKCYSALNKFEAINTGTQNNIPVWKCRHCGCENPNTSGECKSCGRYK